MNRPPVGSQFVVIATVSRHAAPGDVAVVEGEEPWVLQRTDNKFWATVPGIPQPILCVCDVGADPAAPYKAAKLLRKRFPSLFK